MKNVMIDIETLGNKSDAVILTLAAVVFDPETGEIGDSRQIRFPLDQQLEAKRTISADTLRWWMGNHPETFLQNLGETEVSETLRWWQPFFQLMRSVSPLDGTIKAFDFPDVIVWSNGQFDFPILKSYWHQHQLWDFRNERDCRTVFSLFPHLREQVDSSDLIRHNPVHDCLYQIRYLHLCLSEIRQARATRAAIMLGRGTGRMRLPDELRESLGFWEVEGEGEEDIKTDAND